MTQTDYIWTNHAYQRISERRIDRSLIERTISDPDRIQHRPNGSIELQKQIDERRFTVLVKVNAQQEHIIVSCWVDPPFAGTKDFKMKQRYKQIQKATGAKKFWYAVLYQLGI
jgi:hypothetical protein